MVIRAGAKIQRSLWGHSRSFPHIEILAGAAAAAGVCVLVDGYVTPALAAEARTRSPPPTGFLPSPQYNYTVILHFITKKCKIRLVLCRLQYSSAPSWNIKHSLSRHTQYPRAAVGALFIKVAARCHPHSPQSSPRVMMLTVNMSVTQL